MKAILFATLLSLQAFSQTTDKNFEIVGSEIFVNQTVNIQKLKENTEILSEGSFTPNAPGTLLVISATWCGPCNKLQSEVLPKIKQDTGVNIIIFKTAGSDLEQAKSHIDSSSYDVVYANQGKAVNELSLLARGYPTILILDKDLKLVGKHVGYNLTSEIVINSLVSTNVQQ